MDDKQKILILYADAGFGHRSAARSLKAAFDERYADRCVVEMVNPLDDPRVPFYLRDIQTDYDNIVKTVPELYRIGYEVSDGLVPVAMLETALIPMLYEVMKELILRTAPDVIVTTYPAYQSTLDAYFTLSRTSIPMVTVVTDLVGVHHIWFNVGADQWMVPTDKVYQQALRIGLDPDKLEVTGIPVAPEISSDARSRAEIRADLGLQQDKFILLVTGSKRVEGLPGILEGLNHSGHPLELVLVAGGDEDLYHAMRAEDWHLPVRIHNYVNFIPALLRAADAVVCKAGGLIVSEALAAGLPMLLTNVLPGQETGNAEYVISNGAGEKVESSQKLLETTAHWLQNDRQLWLHRRECAQAIGKPQAAYDIAGRVLQLAGTENPPRTVKHLFKRSHLLNIIRRYQERLLERVSSLPVNKP